MKILHLLSSQMFSGAENVVCQIIDIFEKQHIEMCYCSPSGPIGDTLKSKGITYLPLSSFSIKEVRSAIRNFAPDLIHAHDMRASYLAAMASGKIPIISHIHNNSFDSRKLSIKTIAYYLIAAKKAKHIIWVSRSAFSDFVFKSLIKSKSTILYNVINLSALQERASKGEDKYHFDVVFLGRLTTPKNPIRLLNILRLVVDKLPSINIGIIGCGDMESEVMQRAKDMGLSQNITFTGFISNPMRMLQNAKVMVMSSLWEGTPMCVLESLGLGTPVVSTPVDGLKDIVISGRNGYLSDSDGELASMIIKISEDDILREYLSNNALNDARRINDINTYRATLLDIYNKSIE